jgi:signal transduction histidine kinase
MASQLLERQALAGFIGAAALLLLVTGLAILSVRSSAETTRWVSHSHEVIGELEAMSAALSAVDAARLGFIATGDASYLDDREAGVSRLHSHLLTAKLMTADNGAQQRRLRELEILLARRAARVDDLIVTAQTQGLAKAQQDLAMQNVRDSTLDGTARIDAIESAERDLLMARGAADTRSSKFLLVAFAALLLTTGGELGWLYVRIRNETAHRARAAGELERLNSGLEAANHELESFSYSVSHDLRSPLRAIDGYAQMLDEDFAPRLDETGRRYIRTIREGSQRMGMLIDDLLTFSRLSRQGLSRQTVDMTGLARRVAAEILEVQAEPKPHVVIEQLPVALGDPSMLKQVWINLIGNAIKYSSKCAEPRIEVRAAQDGPVVHYEVQDNGVGFDMKYADKLFGVFQRLHAQDEYPGTGVGLAIVQRIVNRHDGSVSAQAERGKGATFRFSLPAERST